MVSAAHVKNRRMQRLVDYDGHEASLQTNFDSDRSITIIGNDNHKHGILMEKRLEFSRVLLGKLPSI